MDSFEQWLTNRDGLIDKIRHARQHNIKQDIIDGMCKLTGAGLMSCGDAYNTAEGDPDIMYVVLQLNGTMRQFNRRKETIQQWFFKQKQSGYCGMPDVSP